MNLQKLKNRPIKVSVSTVNRAKRQSTAILTTSHSPSKSPSPDLSHANGDVNNDGSFPPSAIPEQRPSPAEIRSRTIALLGVPDTVNDARIRALAEPYGTLVKVVLRPDHQGATVEYKDISSAGKAALGLDKHEISPGRFLTIGSIEDLLAQKAEVKSSKMSFANSKDKDVTSKAFGLTPPIKRPNQSGARRGGKGGLGLKGAGVGLSGSRATADRVGEAPDNSSKPEGRQGKPKSNADFKAMFLKP